MRLVCRMCPVGSSGILGGTTAVTGTDVSGGFRNCLDWQVLEAEKEGVQ